MNSKIITLHIPWFCSHTETQQVPIDLGKLIKFTLSFLPYALSTKEISASIDGGVGGGPVLSGDVDNGGMANVGFATVSFIVAAEFSVKDTSFSICSASSLNLYRYHLG